MWPPRLSLPDGTPVSSFTFQWLLDERTVAICPKCGGTWPVFDRPVSPETREPVVTVQVMETGRVDEAIGQDVRSIDNSGPAATVRRIKATRRWTRHIDFADDRISISNHGFKLSLAEIAAFKSGAETVLHRHVGGRDETEQIFEEEIELSIPAHTTLELVMLWKRIWQEGVAIGTTATGVAIQMPFRVVVGLTFDQVTR